MSGEGASCPSRRSSWCMVHPPLEPLSASASPSDDATCGHPLLFFLRPQNKNEIVFVDYFILFYVVVRHQRNDEGATDSSSPYSLLLPLRKTNFQKLFRNSIRG